MKKSNYEVGYKKPPKSTQFKPGRSGNPKGRPKGTRNLSTDLKEELDSKILATEDGHQRKISKQQALIKTLANKALQGDIRALNSIFRLIERTDLELPEAKDEDGTSQTDSEILQDFLNRNKQE